MPGGGRPSFPINLADAEILRQMTLRCRQIIKDCQEKATAERNSLLPEVINMRLAQVAELLPTEIAKTIVAGRGHCEFPISLSDYRYCPDLIKILISPFTDLAWLKSLPDDAHDYAMDLDIDKNWGVYDHLRAFCVCNPRIDSVIEISIMPSGITPTFRLDWMIEKSSHQFKIPNIYNLKHYFANWGQNDSIDLAEQNETSDDAKQSEAEGDAEA